MTPRARVLFLAALCIAAAVPIAHCSVEDLKESRVHFVDQIGNNFLFRGNQPQVDGKFVLDLLKEYVRNVGVTAKHPLPADFRLVDISLLQPGTIPEEKVAFDIEKKFYVENPTVGDLVPWPLVGDAVDPSTLRGDELVEKARSLPDWQADKLVAKMDLVREWMKQEDAPPTVYYFHCGHGQDRTGEFAAAYAMRWLQIPFANLWQVNHDIGMDVPENENAMQWFCFYMKYSHFQSSDKCQRPSTTHRAINH